MSTYAVFQTGGKQYRVSPGDTVRVESLDVPTSGKININDVLLYSENGSLTIGSPIVEGASISAKLVKNGRSKKIRVFHYKQKVRLRKSFFPVDLVRLDFYLQDIQILELREIFWII